MVVNHKCIFNGIKALKVLMPLKIHLWFTTINCMLTVVIWWCLCCYLLIIYCNKLYIIKSFCFWWWNRNEKQKYNTNINICTNKFGPFIHETEHARYMQSSSFGSKKLAPCKFFKLAPKLAPDFQNWHLKMAPGDFSGSYFLGARAAPENPKNMSYFSIKWTYS